MIFTKKKILLISEDNRVGAEVEKDLDQPMNMCNN